MRRSTLTGLRGLAAVLLCAAACSRASQRKTRSGVPLAGPLIPARTTIVTGWDFPDNPLTDPGLDDSRLSQEIKQGFRIFTNTPGEAGGLTPSRVSCNNCHMNGGQRERSLPLVGVAGMFPEYNKRAGRLFTLNDRIVDCFLRSENGTGGGEDALATPTSKEVLAVSAYLTWLGRGYEVGKNPAWRGQNAVAPASLIAVPKLDAGKGEALFKERCVSCHAVDGHGVAIGDKRAGPLWGADSWNDGAGAARVYTLAGMIRYSMPYLDPGSLSDEDAQDLAAFIDSQPRPAYPFKQLDYRTEKRPVDSVYYDRR
jgi:thiosulfate dehydrogenase